MAEFPVVSAVKSLRTTALSDWSRSVGLLAYGSDCSIWQRMLPFTTPRIMTLLLQRNILCRETGFGAMLFAKFA
ncbi:MAG TPA: hypothetical protein VNR88_10610, partial [Hyphomicrobium sp.]|nr:hypothetical protein [Hyphomicrobium sp.]